MDLSRRAALATLLSAPVVAARGKRPTRLTPSPRQFALFDEGTWPDKRAILAELSDQHRLRPVGAAGVLDDLNREADRFEDRVRLYADRSKKRREAYRADAGFVWRRDDSRSTNWYPQGITGSGDACPTGTMGGGRRTVLVSWYPRKTVHKGARISFVDVGSPERVKYRHVLLVEPVRTKKGVTFRPVKIHAGGIVLYRNLLYVADTHWGLRVFDVDAMFALDGDKSRSKVGVRGGRAYGFDYRYALPQVGYYRQYFPTDIRYSFVSLDRTQVPHRLWVGEYEGETGEGYATRFPLDPASAHLAPDERGDFRSEETLRLNRIRTQGFVAAHGSFFFNHTYSYDRYRLHVQRADGYFSLKAGYGLEDMYYDPTLDRLWSHTEHPKSRAVYFIQRPDGP